MTKPGEGSRVSIVHAAVLAAVYLGVALYVLARGFPHEDAFILFKYANQLGCGHGVVFFPGGPHAEGGTDFLWMATLGLARAAGIDPAVGAAAVNALGIFVLARALFASARGEEGRASLGVALATSALLLVTAAAVAGYVGFSAPIYTACAFVLHRTWVRGDERGVTSLPLLGLVLGLVRPDGVVLAAGFGLLGAIDARRRGFLRRYATSAGLATLLGAIYFVARRAYFGAWLPLPLYVKSHYAGTPPGLGETIAWCLSTLIPLGLFAVVGPHLLGAARADLDVGARRRRLVALAPFALHILSFVPAVPSQNIADRFQAPTTVVLFDLALFLGATRIVASPWRAALYVAGAVAALLPQVDMARKEVGFALSPQYANVFAAELGRIDPTARVAATEAGRIPFYTSGPALDLVGLDSPETARTPPTHALLDRFAPDLVMLHHAGTLDERRLDDGSGRDVIPIQGALVDRMGTEWRTWLADPLPPYDELRMQNVVVAPIATAGWLDSVADRYELYAVRFQSRFFHFHVFAVRRDWSAKTRVLEALARAHVEAGAHDYLELQHARGDVCAK